MSFKPDFLGVGAAKAGTTSMHDILAQHPQIYLPSFKEVHFFDMDENYTRGVDWYEQIAFSKIGPDQVGGEFTPSYMYFDHAPKRIQASYGNDIKLIFMLRHPVDRAYSQYQMQYLRGLEELDFEEALAIEAERMCNGDQLTQRRFSYLSRGHYTAQIRPFLELFSRERTYFILFEDFISNRSRIVNGLLDFLSVEYVDLNTDLRSNPASEPRSRILTRLLVQPTSWKSLLKPLVPERVRHTVRQTLRRLNQGQSKSTKLRPDIRQQLYAQHFATETDELAEITGLNLDGWSIDTKPAPIS